VNTSLKEIDLKQNNIQVKGDMAIANALIENASLSSVDLYGNKIQDGGAIAIAGTVTYNPSLSHVRIDFQYGRLFGFENFVMDTFQNLQGLLKL
jgi:hypothetical protein